MSDRLGIFIGECGHPRPISANNRRIGACKCERRTASPHRPDYFEQLAAAVEELGRSRYLLGQVIALAANHPSWPTPSYGTGCSRWPTAPSTVTPAPPNPPTGRRLSVASVRSAPGGRSGTEI